MYKYVVWWPMDSLPRVFTPEMLEERVRIARERGWKELEKMKDYLKEDLVFLVTRVWSSTASWEIHAQGDMSSIIREHGLDYYCADELAI